MIWTCIQAERMEGPFGGMRFDVLSYKVVLSKSMDEAKYTDRNGSVLSRSVVGITFENLNGMPSRSFVQYIY